MSIASDQRLAVHPPGLRTDHVYRRITLRIIPFIFICYIVNQIDRTNIAFAKLQFMEDLGLSKAAYGLGAGLFFIRLYPVRGTEQSPVASDRREKDADPNHASLGRCVGWRPA